MGAEFRLKKMTAKQRAKRRNIILEEIRAVEAEERRGRRGKSAGGFRDRKSARGPAEVQADQVGAVPGGADRLQEVPERRHVRGP